MVSRTCQASSQEIDIVNGWDSPGIDTRGHVEIKIIDQSFSVANNFMVVIYQVADEDYPFAMAVANYIADTFDMETYPLVSADDHARIWDQLALPLD